ncbi:MAG: phosphoadenylyl-sulfate reductase [Bacteroidales bacterium]
MKKEETKKQIDAWNREFKKESPETILSFFLDHYGKEITFASSLGAEDQVITCMMASISRHARIFTLDTGRLFPETYEVLEKTQEKYGLDIEVYFPDYREVEKMVQERGINLFYRSVENRKLCCHIRKTLPLLRALEGCRAWITGLRREQAVTRISVMPVEWDEKHGMVKVNPLYNWSEKQVWDYIGKYDIPYNALHDRGFPSIGCQPCTRAVKPGEDVRAGRWWWEQPENRECGLHPGKNE